MKAIITGGCGFIGSHLVDNLVEKIFEVIVIDNQSADCHDQVYQNNNASYYKYDINDYDLIEPLFADVDYVFHLAAEARIQPTIENPILAIQTNVLGTCNVLEACRKHNVKRVMYSSTSSAIASCCSSTIRVTSSRVFDLTAASKIVAAFSINSSERSSPSTKASTSAVISMF